MSSLSTELPSKLRYLASCVRKMRKASAYQCPSCGAKDGRVVARKFVVTTLRRCNQCRLLFRAPTANVIEEAIFYQKAYRQGFTSEMPEEQELERLLTSRFVGSEKDYSTYIRVLRSLGARIGNKILDFGCSWGYGSWQLAAAGFQVKAHEISKSRCEFARKKLGIEAYNSRNELRENDFDVFFSAHVLEHVPSIRDVVEFGLSKLRLGGLFVAFTPNGSEAFKRRQPDAWQRLWGMVHPNFLDDRFYRPLFPRCLLATNPYDFSRLKTWRSNPSLNPAPDLIGSELLMAYVKPS